MDIIGVAYGLLAVFGAILFFRGNLFSTLRWMCYIITLLASPNFWGNVLKYCGLSARCLFQTTRKTLFLPKTERMNVPTLCITQLQKGMQERLKQTDSYSKKNAVKRPVLISHNVDDVIDEILNYLMRDFILSWYTYIVKQPDVSANLLKEQVWDVLFNTRNRVSQMDEVKFVVSDSVSVLTEHLQNIRLSATDSTEKCQPYKVYSFLSYPEEERDYIRKITEFLLAILLPPKVAEYKPARLLLREALATSVVYPLVQKISDPDWINLQLISLLKAVQAEIEKHNRPYAYAETYEDFIKMIQECGSIEALQRMRYYIVTEIVQATTMSNLKRSRGIDADKEFNPQKTNKGDLLQSRNLSRYLNQLRYAKGLCEKRLKTLGGPDYVPAHRGSGEILCGDRVVTIPGRKVLSMSVIMQSSFCRKHFSKYLQKEEMHSLMGFWEAVEDMKSSDKVMWHKLGNDIVQVYIYDQASNVRLQKNTLKGIEEFIIGNKGPDAFFQAQEEIYKQIEDNCYASFIVSNIYHKMIVEAEKHGIDFTQGSHEAQESETDLQRRNSSSKDTNSDVSMFDYTSYVQCHLNVLQEKVTDKVQALHALRSNPKGEKKVIMMLEKEISDLKSEQQLLEDHVEKTELWIKYLGLWNSTIVDAEVVKENEKHVPYFTVLVHLASQAGYMPTESIGWVVPRSLSAFHSLQQKLVPAATWLKKIELPTKPRFKSLDKNYLNRMKNSLQTFLSAIMKDDGLNKSEALCTFLNPSPELLKSPFGPPKKAFRLNIMQFFKGGQTPSGVIGDTCDDELLFLDDIDSKEDKKDSIAEPIYDLIGELFELKGLFNWIRKTLIIFVQITYGQTINRQIREIVSYFLSEPMLLFYLQSFRDLIWPNGVLGLPSSHRTKAQKLETRIQAKEMIINSIPEIINNLLGHQNTSKGATKIFEAFQNQTLNKQLYYTILEAFLCDFAPELKQKVRS